MSFRATKHVQVFNALQGVIREGKALAKIDIQLLYSLKVCKHCICQLIALLHMKAVDTLEVGKSSICDGGLVAACHFESVNTSEVDKSGIRDGRLAAKGHIKSVYTLKVHKSSIRNILGALRHMQGMYALEVHKGCICDVVVLRYI